MKSARFGVAVFGAGLAVALGLFAYLLDQGRASARLIRGLGEAAEPSREEALIAPEEDEDEIQPETVPERHPLPVMTREPDGLEVCVQEERGRKVRFAYVLVYRGHELLRADDAMSGTATLIPFDGPGSVRIERNGSEVAQLEIPQGRGRYTIVVPELPSVAGVVRVGGLPREGIRLQLATGSDDWLGSWIAYGLETVGLSQRQSVHIDSTAADGTFRYEDLAPEWSGVLRLEDPDDYRFARGPQRLELAHPEEGLVLDVVARRPQVQFRGRVVFRGEPVPRALWQLNPSTWSQCDELGRFSIFAFPEELKGSRLEFSKVELGSRVVELMDTGMLRDLGDVELFPERVLAFVVRSESGAPIAGAHVMPRLRQGASELDGFVESLPRSVPTDAEGGAVLRSLRPDEDSVMVSSRGHASVEVNVPADATAPIPVVLSRSASAQVVLRDGSGRVPQGLCVRVESRSKPFTFADGLRPRGDELTYENFWGVGSRDGNSVEFLPDAHGRVWIDALRPDAPFDLSAQDEYGSVVASARGVVLADGEWRRVELAVETRPRTLLVVVHDTLGHPLAGANVALWPVAGAEPAWSRLSTDRAGMVRSGALYANEVALRVKSRGFESRALERVAVPPEGATLEIRLAHDWWSW